MFGKTYELSLSKNYVRHWGIAEAVRELIQNALDSESPFVYEIDREDDGLFTLSLFSEFATLTPQSLLMGATTKAEAADKIGSFGEGYKIALLVLTREGLPTEIWNGDRNWRPFFQFSRKYDDDLLCIEESSMPHPHKGLRFLVSGLNSDQVEEVRTSCLQMQDQIGAIRSTPKGDILLEREGMLYVGGLFICKTEMKFGYNVKPEHIRLERDRKTVDSWDFQSLTRDMWFATGEHDRIAQMIEAGVPDVEYARFHSPEMVKEACYRLFRSKHPGAIVAESNTELQELIASGMKEVIYVGAGYGSLVRSSRGYRSEVAVAPPPRPAERMKAWWNKARYHMHADHRPSFEALLKESENWTLARKA